MIHILGAPRTGSTLMYQLVINFFHVNYFANNGTIRNTDDMPVPYVSEFGKTQDAHEPSEASYVLKRWFGEDKDTCPHKRTEMMNICEYHKPLVFKNVWNIYRVDEWVHLFPDVQFIWIQRDVQDAAASDLKARKETGCGLNNAYRKFSERDLSNLPEHVQVFEQQRDMNKTIEVGLANKSFIQIWYNDLCTQTRWELSRLQRFLNAEYRDREIPKLIAHVR